MTAGLLFQGSYYNSWWTEVPALIKISASGDVVWQHSYGESVTCPAFLLTNTPRTLAETSDGTLLWMADAPFLSCDPPILGLVWLGQLSADGNILSQKLPLDDFDPNADYIGPVVSLAIPDGVMVGGLKCELPSPGGSCINLRGWIAKYSNAGALQWQKQIDVPNFYYPEVHFIRQTSDGFLVGIGTVSSGFAVSILLKLNSSGDLQWSKSFDDPLYDQFYFESTQDGGVIAVRSWPQINLIKFNESGTIVWDKAYDPLPGINTGVSGIAQGSDGAFYVIGSYSCDQETDEHFVMKISEDGDSCSFISENTTPESVPSVTVTSFDPPSETSGTATVLAGELTRVDSASSPTPICTSESGLLASTNLLSAACGGNSVSFVFPASGESKKTIIHNYGFPPYPEPDYQTEDRIIKIRARVTDSSGNGLNGTEVFFTVKDPSDTAPYIPLSDPGENKDKDDNDSGKVNPASDQSESVDLNNNGQIEDNEIGIVETYLTISDQYAGDNYQIEARFNSDTDPIQATSGTIEAWKRISLEKDLMFRRGSYVKGGDNVGGANRIHVVDKSKFNSCTRVRIIHAPRLDGQDPAPAFYSEEHNMTGTVTDPNGEQYVLLSAGETLTNNYGADPSFGGFPYLSDGVGCIAGSNPIGVYDLNESKLQQIYDTSFVEFISLGAAASVPFEDTIAGQDKRTQISNKWFENSYRDPQNPIIVLAPSNVQHVLSGKQRLETGVFGTTTVDDGANHSWVWTGRIESRVSGATNQAKAKAEVLVHELAHQWYVNHDEPAYTGGHCDKYMYNATTIRCTMHNTQTINQLKDDYVAFHYFVKPDDSVDSEYMTIRGREEPVPQDYP